MPYVADRPPGMKTLFVLWFEPVDYMWQYSYFCVCFFFAIFAQPSSDSPVPRWPKNERCGPNILGAHRQAGMAVVRGAPRSCESDFKGCSFVRFDNWYTTETPECFFFFVLKSGFLPAEKKAEIAAKSPWVDSTGALHVRGAAFLACCGDICPVKAWLRNQLAWWAVP